MSHGADTAFHAAGIGDAAQRGRDHVAVLEGADELRTLVWIVAQPVQQLGESPFGGVHAAAPLDGLEFVSAREFRDERGFLLGAVIAPQVVVVEGDHAFADRDDAGSSRVERNGFDPIAGDARGLHGLPRRLGERPHVIFVRLSREVRIFAFAMQGIFGDRRGKQAAFAVYDRDAHA